jgi:dolichyl-phosphate-mannose--protein O-mannosyl transferase
VSSQPKSVAIFRRFLPYGYWFVTVLAGFLRFFNLGYPKVLVFDETYYVKDAWTLWNKGFEASWPANPNPDFVAGKTHEFLSQASFVVHPPLGKWLIALPMGLFGAEHSWTWRLTVALIGTAAVLLLMLVAKRLTGSQSFAVLAGLLMAIDGHAIVLSRIALLDGILMSFVLLAFYFLLLDRDQSRLKYQLQAITGKAAIIRFRPWLIACAAALGLATAVKWSGLYFALFFGLYVVVSEALLRRRLGQKFWFADGIIGQGVANLVLMLPVYAVVYVANWLGWILTSGGWDRTAKGTWIESLIYYHQQIYNFHVGLHTPHNYASNPLTWLFLGRPVALWYEASDCPPNPNGCSAALQAIGNPFIWWGAFAALLWLVFRFVQNIREKRMDNTIGLILLGVAAGYLPWLLYMGRTVFQFYAIAFEPFLILGLVYALRSAWYAGVGTHWRRAIPIYLISVVLVSVFFLNLWWGFVTPYWYWYSHMWFGSFWI